jgi:hypothetical protein
MGAEPFPREGPVLAVFVVVLLGLTLLPVILGVRAARAKGRSPHWMWFGVHPVTGWIAYIWLRFFASPVTRAVVAPLTTRPDPELVAQPSPPPQPQSERVVVGRCEACQRELRVKSSALSLEMRLTCKCGHVNIVRKFGKCKTCKRLIPLEQAHVRTSYYDLEVYEDSYCPHCFREGDIYRGRLQDKKGNYIGKNYR